MKRPAPLLWIALALAAGLSWWSMRPTGDANVVEVTAPRPRTASGNARPEPTRTPPVTAAPLSWQRTPMGGAEADLFGTPAPAAPPPVAEKAPAPVAPAPPPPPAPPPLRYLGQLSGVGNGVQVYLALGDEYLIASPGDTVAGRFRLDKLDDRFVEFTDLTTRQPLRVPLGER